MKTSMATVSLAGPLPDKLAAIAAAGFDDVEIFDDDLWNSRLQPRAVAAMARDLGLRISMLQPLRDFEGLPEPHRRDAFDRAERCFEVMQELEAGLMLVCSSVSPMALGGIERIAADFRELGERAAARGLRVGYEALAWGKHVDDHRDAWEIVRRTDHSNIGLILDSFHTLARGIDPSSIRSIPKHKIFAVQLSDAPLVDMDLMQWSRRLRRLPGEGGLPVAEFTRAVMATGYDGSLSIEVFAGQNETGPPGLVALDAHRSLLALIETVRSEPAEGRSRHSDE